ncbi:MAG: hypothetical protein AAFP15_12215 [Bacteroidota bacterium]
MGISPAHAHRSGFGWNTVSGLDLVPTGDPRNFYVEVDIPTTDDGEVFGNCFEHTATLRVWASYGALDSNDAKDIIATDNHQLWQELNRAQIPGVPLFVKDGWEPESEEGRQWGAHVFTVTMYLPTF